jgi:peptidoglycan hydrolase-like protein with peptidoglycan-binding domain
MIAWLAAVTLGLGFVAALVARAKGRSFFAWWAYGTLLGVVAVPHALLLRDRRDEQDWQFSRFGFPGPSRSCPNCGATVYPEAIVCRRCRHPLYDGAVDVTGVRPNAANRATASAASGASAAGSSNSPAFAWLDDAFSRVAMDDDSPVVGRQRDSKATWDKVSREEGLTGLDEQSHSPSLGPAAPDSTRGERRRESVFSAAPNGADKDSGRDDWIPMGSSPAAHGDARIGRRDPSPFRHASRIAVGALIAAVVLFVAWRTTPLFPELLTWAMLNGRFESSRGDTPAIVAAPNIPQSPREPQASPSPPAVPKDDVRAIAPPMEDPASPKQAQPTPEIDKPMPPVANLAPVQEAMRQAPDPEPPARSDEGTATPPPETKVMSSSDFIAAVEKVLRESRGGTRSPTRSGAGVTASGEIVTLVQQRLRQRGYNPGAVDGRAGPQTQTAIRAFQRDAGMKPDGEIDILLLQRLGIVGEQIFVFGRERQRTVD